MGTSLQVQGIEESVITFCFDVDRRENPRRPLLRGLLMALFLVYFIVSAAVGAASTSVWSHVGGFLCGLFPSFLFLPNLRSEKWEQILPILGGFVMLGVFVALPTYFYRHRLPQLQCS